MKILNKIGMGIAVLFIAVMMAACSTLKTTVIPQSQNQYTVVATAESGSTAINGAIKRAQQVCTNQGKTLAVISHKTKYQGAGKTLGTVTNMVSKMAFFAGDINTVPTSKTAEDYKTTVVFTCQ